MNSKQESLSAIVQPTSFQSEVSCSSGIDRAGRASSSPPSANSSGIARSRKGRCNALCHEHEVTTDDLWWPDHRSQGTRTRRARSCAEGYARGRPRRGRKHWSIQMEGYGGPAQPSPTIAQCLNGGYGWLEVECHRCKTRASIPPDAIRRPRDSRAALASARTPLMNGSLDDATGS